MHCQADALRGGFGEVLPSPPGVPAIYRHDADGRTGYA
jgi:hypothetical protein